MKNVKKLFSSIIVVGMLLTMGLSTFADDAQYRWIQCENCGYGVVTATTFRGNWEYAGEVNCIHEGGAGQRDEKWVRVVTTYYSCSSCDYGESYSSMEEEFRHI